MSADEDFEAYRREQLTQVRDIRVTDEGLQSFEEGLVRIIVRSEGSSQELKLNELELQALAGAAGAYLVKKIPGAPDVAALKAAIRAAEEHTEQLAGAEDTQRIDLQDAVMDELKYWADAQECERKARRAGNPARRAELAQKALAAGSMAILLRERGE